MTYAYSLDKNMLRDYFLNKLGTDQKETLKDEHLKIFINHIYRSPYKDINAFTQLPKALLESYQTLNFSLPKIIKEEKSSDGTTKFLVEFKDKRSVEMVLLPFYKKYTLCLSSQVGCAMGCKFCYTAKQGLKRGLKSEEIISEFMLAKKYLRDHKIKRPLTNIVFMGQGEPLHNFDELKKSIHILTMRDGLSVSEKNITVSTVGYLPGIKRFSELGGVNFALSLHAVDNNLRKELIPLANKFNIDDIISEIDKIKLAKKQTIEYEYILIKNFNDSKEHAQDLYHLLSKRSHMINIIPFNPYPNSRLERPDKSDVLVFKNYCVSLGLRVMIRTTKGDDILAACGQLKTEVL